MGCGCNDGRGALSEELEKYRALLVKKETLEARLREVKEILAKHEEDLAQQFLEDGVQSVKSAQGDTFFIRRDLYCSKRPGVDMGAVVLGLRAAGLDDFLEERYVPGQLKAYVRELDKRFQREHPGAEPQEALPETIRDLLIVATKIKVVRRKETNHE